MACLICHKDFEVDDDVVAVDRIRRLGDLPWTHAYVHLWHLSALPSSGGGR